VHGKKEKKRENPEKDDQDDCQRQTGKRRRRRGIQREDNAVSNVRGITMRRRKPADWLLLRFAGKIYREDKCFLSVRQRLSPERQAGNAYHDSQ